MKRKKVKSFYGNREKGWPFNDEDIERLHRSSINPFVLHLVNRATFKILVIYHQTFRPDGLKLKVYFDSSL